MTIQKIAFSKNHNELLTLNTEAENSTGLFSLLRSTYDVVTVENLSNYEELKNSKILVIGAPSRRDLEAIETASIKKFVETGGGLLLVSNSQSIRNPLSQFEQLIDELLGLEITEFLNSSPEVLESFSPHNLTANVGRVRVGELAHLINSSELQRVSSIARTIGTQRTIIACAEVKQGRVVVVTDVELFNDFLYEEDNQTLVTNIFSWLSRCDSIEVVEVLLPDTIKWGQNGIVTLKLYNPHDKNRLKVKCVLESDKDAINEFPVKERSVLPKQETLMQWTVQPRILGEQSLRMSIEIIGKDALYFDKLPEVRYLSPEPLYLEIRNNQDKSQSIFKTGDEFFVYGGFYDAINAKALLSQLNLKLSSGLRKLNQKIGQQMVEWKVKAIEKGGQELKLEVSETGQALPLCISVQIDEADQRDEIEITYVRPLDVEIEERLIRVCSLFREVTSVGFKILSPQKYIAEVYTPKDVKWLGQLLEAAEKENTPNPSYGLLGLFMVYIVPCYSPVKQAAFIPHAPTLSSNLGRIYPTNKDFLRYNLLCSNESEDFEIKQHIAAYLLHEKYGHGFFYTQTRLGQQLTLLERYKPLQKQTEADKAHHEAAKLVSDSSIVVNEGFAAWLEIFFLNKLDRDVRQATELRRIFLLEQSSGFLELAENSLFLKKFRPNSNSIYREGFEYFDLISSKLGHQCAIQALLLVTDLDLGIAENEHGELTFDFQPIKKIGVEQLERIRSKLFSESISWRSHHKLQQMYYSLSDYEKCKDIISEKEKKNCAETCHPQKCVLRYLCDVI